MTNPKPPSDLPWVLDKPATPGVFLLYCDGWKRRYRVVVVAMNEEGTAMHVRTTHRCSEEGFAPVTLGGFNSLAQRVIWWLRLEDDTAA